MPAVESERFSLVDETTGAETLGRRTSDLLLPLSEALLAVGGSGFKIYRTRKCSIEFLLTGRVEKNASTRWR